MGGRDGSRPDPEALLRQVQAEEHVERSGRLKIFLGYASRVGKSFRMLDEGRRRKQRGQDVVVGLIQGKLAPEVRQLLDTLEVIPPLRTEVEGRGYEALDVAAILRRRPQVCLVDELAHDNPPGSRNRARWEDVADLLESGITVVTAVNLQHIAEQQDKVEQITGKRAAFSVPEKFVRTADEIVLVDVPPEDVRERSDRAAAADSGRLSALREMALLLAAEVVDEQLRSYMSAHGLEMPSAGHERILVCLTPRSNMQRMLELASYTAQRFHAELLALNVRQAALEPRDETNLEKSLDQARKLGATVFQVEAADSVAAIIAFARQHGITQLFVGHSMRQGWRTWLAGDPLHRLIRLADGMDVRIFPHPAGQ